MPTYQYACTACDERLEAVQSFSDAPLMQCPACGGPLRKVFSAVGVVFKGSGFYKTDSRSSSKAAGSSDGAAAGSSSGGSSSDGAASSAPAGSGSSSSGSASSGSGTSSSNGSSSAKSPAPAASKTA